MALNCQQYINNNTQQGGNKNHLGSAVVVIPKWPIKNIKRAFFNSFPQLLAVLKKVFDMYLVFC